MRNKGITLVALVITVIILIILASISLNILLGEDGLITKASNGGDKYKEAERNETDIIRSVEDFLNTVTLSTSTGNQESEPIKTETCLTEEYDSDNNTNCTISSSTVWGEQYAYKGFTKGGGWNAWVAYGYAPQWLSIKFKDGVYKPTKISFINYYLEGGNYYSSSSFYFQGRNSDDEEYETIYTFDGSNLDTVQTIDITTDNYYSDFRFFTLAGIGYSGLGSIEIYGIPE